MASASSSPMCGSSEATKRICNALDPRAASTRCRRTMAPRPRSYERPFARLGGGRRSRGRAVDIPQGRREA
jgi:hypothetical protein